MAHPHGISGLVGKLIAESEVNCDADKYYKIFKHHEEVPAAIPHIYTSAKAVEGHGLTSGCIKEWGYNHEGKTLTVREKSTYDDETRTILHSAVGGDIMNAYKKYDATLVVNPKANGHGCIVKWTIEYEKINEDSPVPIAYLALLTQTTEETLTSALPVKLLMDTSIYICNGKYQCCVIRLWSFHQTDVRLH